jgi:hypothetical protein
MKAPLALTSVLIFWAVALLAQNPLSHELANEIETQIQFLAASDALVTRFEVHGDTRQAALTTYSDYAHHKLHTPVYFVPLTNDTDGLLLGLTSCPQVPGREQCVILVDTSRSKSNGQLATLMHEIAHRLQKDHVRTTLEAEIWAETVAWLVQRELGFNTTRESISYLALIPEHDRRLFLSTKEPEIRKVVERLVKVGKKN